MSSGASRSPESDEHHPHALRAPHTSPQPIPPKKNFNDLIIHVSVTNYLVVLDLWNGRSGWVFAKSERHGNHGHLSTARRRRNARLPLHHLQGGRFRRDAYVMTRFGAVEDPGSTLDALLDAGADPMAEDDDSITPWNLAKENDELRGSDAYWGMNDARFADPPREVRPPATTLADRREFAVASEPQSQRPRPGCEIPGKPTPTDIRNVSASWCAPTVDFHRDTVALQATRTLRAIDDGSSSRHEHVNARRYDVGTIRHVLDGTQASALLPQQYPPDYRP